MSGRGRQQQATKRPQRLTEPSPPPARKRQPPQPPDHSRRPETSRRSSSPAPSWPVQPVPTAEQIAAFLRAQPQPPTSTTTSNTSGILIAGSSLIARLASFMQHKKLSWNLPLTVRLLGKPGLQLSQLRASLDEAIKQTPPAYLVLHTGTNDIGRLNLREWIRELTTGVLYIRARWPNTHVIWSDMLPRLTWKYSTAQPGAENARKQNQRRARALAYQEHGILNCEAWNNSFWQLVGHHHPGVWTTIECLRMDQALAATKLTQAERGEPPRKKQKRAIQQSQIRLRTLCQEFAAGTRPLELFLEAVARNIRLM
ncbi:hypothetical protein ACOMHN_025031 [Nucella lapillus]